MTKKLKQTTVSSALSRDPYKRREESEIIKIHCEIDRGMISKLGACKKCGLNRNTLRLWITKLSVRTLEGKISNTFLLKWTKISTTIADSRTFQISGIWKAKNYRFGDDDQSGGRRPENQNRKKPGTKPSKD